MLNELDECFAIVFDNMVEQRGFEWAVAIARYFGVSADFYDEIAKEV